MSAMQRSSDLVARLHELHRQQQQKKNSTVAVAPVRFTQPVPQDVQTRLLNVSLTFDALPPLLQRALLWDSGYSIGDDDSLAQIYTRCNVSMAEIAVPTTALNVTNECTVESCVFSTAGTTVTRATTCSFDALARAARCSATAVNTLSNASLWSNASVSASLEPPDVRLRRHSWEDTERGERVHVYALHTSPTLDGCSTGLVIPCVPFQRSDAQWCRPPPTPEMTAWLQSFSRAFHRQNNDSAVVGVPDDSRPANGSTSDLAAQFYRLHQSGVVVPPMAIDGDLPAAITQRLDAVSLHFKQLPPLLQRALVWDTGFAYGDGNRLAAVFVRCGGSMAELAVSRRVFNAAGCVEHNCTDAVSLATFSRSLQCSGDQIAAVSRCATTAVTTAVHAAMWADGVDDALVPTPTVLRHAWEASDRSFLIHSIHMAGSPVAYGRCPARGAIIIPCLPYEAVSASRQWCRPAASPLVSAWLRDVANAHAFSLWLLLPVLLAVAFAVTALACCLRHKTWSRWQWRWCSGLKDSPLTLTQSRTTVSHRELSSTTSRNSEWLPQQERLQWWFGSASLTSRSSLESAGSPPSLQALASHPQLAQRRIQFNDLQLQRLLATGGHGEVWLCLLHGERVAVKRRLRHRRGRRPDDLDAFVAEIELSASLDHPNVLRFLGVAWSSPSNLCMVTEYLANGDLQAYLKDHGAQLSWDSGDRLKLRIASGIARAVVYLHAQRPPTIHRDLKAKNVLLSERLDAKLMDFGGSRQKTGDMLTNGVGTPYWTAPEILQGATYAESADVFSLGVVLCELDTAQTPYAALPLAPLQILERVAAGALRPSLSRACPAAVAALVASCLQQDPTARPTASELLERCVAGDVGSTNVLYSL